MPSLLTQCPHCLTSFRVTETQLQAADGLVRCGACLGVFSAESNRITLKRGADGAPVEESFDEDEPDGDDTALTPAHAEAAQRNDLQDSPVDAVEPESEAERYDDAYDTEEDDEQESDLEPEEETDEEPEASDEDSDEESEGPDEDLEDETDDYVFVLPGEDASSVDVARPLRPSAPAFTAAGDAERADEDIVDDDDIEVSLGDLNLDLSDDFATADEYDSGDDDDDDDDDDDADEYDREEDEDEDDADVDEESAGEFESVTYAVVEEYSDASDDAEHDESAALANRARAADEDDDEDADEAEYEDDEAPPPAARRPERANSDKTALRQYLSRIEDDDALDPLDDDALDALDEPLTFDAAPRRSALWAFALLLGIVALVGILMWQYIDENIGTLSRSSRFAPALPYVCRVVDCPAPQRSQLDALVYEQLVVRSHPRLAQALEVTFVFRNDASAAQPFPAIELNFSDSNNRLLANRLFKPAEYLPPDLQRSEMPPQSSLQVTLELADPGSDAVNYTLAFHAP